MLKVDHLNIYYGESHILHDVDLEVAPGQIVCLLGRNGVGKTTLLKGGVGVLPSRKGTIYFDKKEVTARFRPPADAPAEGGRAECRRPRPGGHAHENLLVG